MPLDELEDWMKAEETPLVKAKGCGICIIRGKRYFAVPAMLRDDLKFVVIVPVNQAIQIVQEELAERN